MAIVRNLWCLVVLFFAVASGTHAAVNDESDLFTPQLRAQMGETVRQAAIKGAINQVNANRFLSTEKKLILKRYVEKVFTQTQFVPLLVDAIIDKYGARIFTNSPKEAQELLSLINEVYLKVGASGLSYLSDVDRRMLLEDQLEIMSRLEPHYCVLYATGQLTIDSMARNASANLAFIQTLSDERFKAMLQSQLNIYSLGALHRGKIRSMPQEQIDEALIALGDAIIAWMGTFSPEDQALFKAYLVGDLGGLSERDFCAISMSLAQMAAEAEGEAGKLVRLAWFLPPEYSTVRNAK